MTIIKDRRHSQNHWPVYGVIEFLVDWFSHCLIIVVILCMHSALIGGKVQKLLLETAYDMQMMDGSLVFMPYDTLLYSLPYHNVSYPALKGNSKLLRAYDAVMTVTIDSPQTSFYEVYREAMGSGEVKGTLQPQQVIRRSSLTQLSVMWTYYPETKPVSCRCLLSLGPSIARSSSWLMQYTVFIGRASGCQGATWRDTHITWIFRFEEVKDCENICIKMGWLGIKPKNNETAITVGLQPSNKNQRFWRSLVGLPDSGHRRTLLGSETNLQVKKQTVICVVCVWTTLMIWLVDDRIDMETLTVLFLGHNIHFPQGSGPKKDSSCWFTPGVICSGGESLEPVHGCEMGFVSCWPIPEGQLNWIKWGISKTVSSMTCIPLCLLQQRYSLLFQVLTCSRPSGCFSGRLVSLSSLWCWFTVSGTGKSLGFGASA